MSAAAAALAAQAAERLERAARALGALGALHAGATPREPVYREGGLRLYRYRAPGVRTTRRTPILVVYALVNRPTILDLEPGRSFLAALQAGGHPLYLLDWGDPQPGDRDRPLAEYVRGRLARCVAEVAHRHGERPVHLVGVCQGGVLALCHAALAPETVRRLVLMVTPVDFHTRADLLGLWARHLDVDALAARLGNVPGALLNWAFLALRPFTLGAGKYLEALEALGCPARAASFVRMEGWLGDCPDQPGEMFRGFVRAFYQDNALLRGTLTLGGEPVRLEALTMPVLNCYATRDHIVPPAAARALGRRLAGRDYTALAFRGGHIGVFVSAAAQRSVAPRIVGWLAGRGTRLRAAGRSRRRAAQHPGAASRAR